MDACRFCKSTEGLFECTICKQLICYEGYTHIQDTGKFFCLVHSNPYGSVCWVCAEIETGESFAGRRFW